MSSSPFLSLCLLLVAGCLAERTAVVCATCKEEPYIAVSELRFETRWGARCWNREAQPVACAHSDYDVRVRCTTPCRSGNCELGCWRRDPEPGVVQMIPASRDGSAGYTGPVAVEVTLRKHDSEFHYRSPTIWFSNEGIVLLCPDQRRGATHPMMPCLASGVSAREPLFAIAIEDEDPLFSPPLEPSWELVDRAVINEKLVSASRQVTVRGIDVPLFSLADIFLQFRDERGGVVPAHYQLSVATAPGEPRASQSLEVDVR